MRKQWDELDRGSGQAVDGLLLMAWVVAARHEPGFLQASQPGGQDVMAAWCKMIEWE
jgi:hypothetical protein